MRRFSVSSALTFLVVVATLLSTSAEAQAPDGPFGRFRSGNRQICPGAGSLCQPIPVCVLALDCVGDTPAVAYSTVKVRAAYNGNCMTILRISDNTTTNIGFVSNVCDQATAQTFCNATTCFLTRWNDQSGNGIDCVPDAADHSPNLKFNDQNGKIGLDFANGGGTTGTVADCKATLLTGVSQTTIQGVLMDTCPSTGGDLFSTSGFGATSYARLNNAAFASHSFIAVRNDGGGSGDPRARSPVLAMFTPPSSRP